MVTQSQITDLIAGTLSTRPVKLTDISQAGGITKYRILSEIWQKHKMKLTGGNKIEFDLDYIPNDSTQASSLYDEDKISVNNTLTTGELPFRFIKQHWAYDVRESFLNGKPEQIINVIENRRRKSLIGAHIFAEDKGWGFTPATDSENMFGLQNFIVPKTGAAEDVGYNSALPTGYSTIAGIDPTVATRWKSGTGIYSAFTSADLVWKLYEMFYMLGYAPPVQSSMVSNQKPQYMLATTLDVINNLNQMVEGKAYQTAKTNKVSLFDGVVTYKGVLFEAVDKLTQVDRALTTQEMPIFVIDWTTWKFYHFNKNIINETPPTNKNTGSHNTFAGWLDIMGNFACTDITRNGCLTKATS